jgi:hypothetical protein
MFHTRGMDFLARLSKLREQLKGLGLEKERAALALLSLSFFGILWFLMGVNGPSGIGPLAGALSICYVTAFLGVAAQWFWARWFASGLGWSGFMMGLASLVMLGWHPALGIYAGLHGLIIAALMGNKMAARYELQPAWREKYGMDEFGVTRLGKAVTRGSASLPSLLMWALAPREGQSLLMQLLPALAFILGALGVAAVLKLRTWGLLALGAAGALVLVLTRFVSDAAHLTGFDAGRGGWWLLGTPQAAAVSGLLVVAWISLALLPFVAPALRYLRGRA